MLIKKKKTKDLQKIQVNLKKWMCMRTSLYRARSKALWRKAKVVDYEYNWIWEFLLQRTGLVK